MSSRGVRVAQPGSVDARIRAIAARQHGIASARQLLAVGVTRHAIRHRLARGDLSPVHRGVYAVGPVRGPRWREWAALLAAGETAVVSHETAAGLHGLVHSRRTPGPTQVTVRRGRPGSRPGLRVHRTTRLGDDEIRTVDGLPVTAPVRTLVDLAGEVRSAVLERMVSAADRTGLLDGVDLETALRRYAGHAGIGALRMLWASGGVAFTRSELEERFLTLIRDGGLPEPATNVRVAGLEVDALWRAEALVAEVDGFGVHRGRAAFERDRRRDAVLVAAGYRVARFTWTEVTTRGLVVLARLARAIGWAQGAAARGVPP